MFLTLDETTVNPPGLQLFDHVITELRLNRLSASWDPNTVCRVQASLGFVNHSERVTLSTRDFQLSELPELSLFNNLLHSRNHQVLQVWGYEGALLNFLRYSRRVHVAFQMENGRMIGILVQLGNLSIEGAVNIEFDSNQYFGESTKLVDAT